MIKFILAVIAMIFVGLAAYVYMNPKETHVSVAKVVQETETSIAKKETPAVQKESVSTKVEVVSEKKVDIKLAENVVQINEVQSSDNVEIENDIGKGLTLESIQSMNVSEDEKERLRDDLAYYQTVHSESSEPLNEKIIFNMMNDDLQLGY